MNLVESHSIIWDWEIKGGTMTTQQHGPVFEVVGEIVSLIYRCARCGEKIEVSSCELHKKHICPRCGKQINFVKRALYLNGRVRTAASN
jgi:DNA-directed RNA polymerase subunit RPC12/RpoP